MTDSAQAADGSLELLHIRIDPSPHILICGGGPDAVPLAAQVRALGWRCTVIDHRPAYADRDRFAAGVEVLAARPDALGDHVVLRHFSAAMIMSHHLDHDATYLEQVLSAGLDYVGLLGPSDRRARLLERIGRPDARVHGPAGLDIGAELPESIALSIMAEIHAVLNGRQGQSLARG